MEEQWKPIDEQELSHYSISNYGRIRTSTGRILEPPQSEKYITLRTKSKRNTSRVVARLVITHFGDPIGSNIQFKDGNVFNPRIDNIYWKHSKDKIKSMILDMSTDNTRTIKQILESYNWGSSWESTKKRSWFNELWKETLGKEVSKRKPKRYSDELIEVVCELLVKGFTLSSISKIIKNYEICKSILTGNLSNHPIVKEYDLSKVDSNTKIYKGSITHKHTDVDTEEWRQIIIDDITYNYEVSTLGRIRRMDARYIMRTRFNNGVIVDLVIPDTVNEVKRSKRKRVFVAIIVANTFLDSIYKHCRVAFIDNNPYNVKLDNLYYKLPSK